MTNSISQDENQASPAATIKARVAKRRGNAATSKPKPPVKATGAKKAPPARKGSKTAKILDLLKRPGGVTLKELEKATGWQAHSVRGFLSGDDRQEDGNSGYILQTCRRGAHPTASPNNSRPSPPCVFNPAAILSPMFFLSAQPSPTSQVIQPVFGPAARANKPASRRTASRVPPACEGERISFPTACVFRVFLLVHT